MIADWTASLYWTCNTIQDSDAEDTIECLTMTLSKPDFTVRVAISHETLPYLELEHWHNRFLPPAVGISCASLLLTILHINGVAVQIQSINS